MSLQDIVCNSHSHTILFALHTTDVKTIDLNNSKCKVNQDEWHTITTFFSLHFTPLLSVVLLSDQTTNYNTLTSHWHTLYVITHNNHSQHSDVNNHFTPYYIAIDEWIVRWSTQQRQQYSKHNNLNSLSNLTFFTSQSLTSQQNELLILLFAVNQLLIDAVCVCVCVCVCCVCVITLQLVQQLLFSTSTLTQTWKNQINNNNYSKIGVWCVLFVLFVLFVLCLCYLCCLCYIVYIYTSDMFILCAMTVYPNWVQSVSTLSEKGRFAIRCEARMSHVMLFFFIFFCKTRIKIVFRPVLPRQERIESTNTQTTLE